MESQLHTIHARAGREDLVIVGDRSHPLGIVPPLWAIWRGLWIVLAAQIAAIVLTGALVPAASGTVWLGLVALTLLEGPTLERLEWRLRGWREVGWTDAATEEGAEENYLTGKAVTP